MQIYPFQTPIILNDEIFSLYGGNGTGTFSSQQLQSAYLIAEIQVTNYIGTPLLPVIVTGTYPYMGQKRIPTDYGYVSQLLNVDVLSKGGPTSFNLISNPGYGFIYSDTFGYIDFGVIASACGWSWWGWTYSSPVVYNLPYQVQIAYQAGLPSGTANQPTILRALTILAQIDLDETYPGMVGVNESVGAIGIQEFKTMDYSERRTAHALVKTALGDDARSQRAKKLIDATLRKARRVLLA